MKQNSTTNRISQQVVCWDALCLSEGDQRLDAAYFDGSTPGDETYAYEWTGDPGLSSSQRVPLIERTPELLRWMPGVSAWDFIQDVFQAAGTRLYCDEQRRWYLVDDSHLAPGYTTIAEGLNLTAGTEKICLDSKLWADAVFVTLAWTDADGDHTAYEWAALSDRPVRTLIYELQRRFRGDGFAAYALKRAQARDALRRPQRPLSTALSPHSPSASSSRTRPS